MKCPGCHAELQQNAKFCGKCGQRIPRCPTCGEPILTRVRFCSKDGTPIPQEILDWLPPAPTAPRPQRGLASARQAPPARPQQRQEYDSKQRTLIIVISAVSAVILIAACILFVLAAGGRLSAGKSGDNGKIQNQQAPSDSWLVLDGRDHMTEPPAIATEPPTEAPTAPPTAPPTQPPTEPPTEAPTEPEIDADPRLLYVIENCDSTYLTESDLSGFDKEMCRIARNALYAKSGRKFKDAELQEFFEQFSWYYPSVEPSAFTGSMFNKYQSANLNLISAYERDHGYR